MTMDAVVDANGDVVVLKMTDVGGHIHMVMVHGRVTTRTVIKDDCDG